MPNGFNKYPRHRGDRCECLMICPGCGTAEWSSDDDHPLFCIHLTMHDDMKFREMRPASELEVAEAEACL